MKPAAFERDTRQRQAIRRAFERVHHPLSVNDLVTAAAEAGERVSLTTAYRTVRALVDDGALTAVEVPGAGTYFEAAGKSHHHHFSCLQCRRAYELPECDAPQPHVPAGFRAVSHETVVYGVCATCASDPSLVADGPPLTGVGARR